MASVLFSSWCGLAASFIYGTLASHNTGWCDAQAIPRNGSSCPHSQPVLMTLFSLTWGYMGWMWCVPGLTQAFDVLWYIKCAQFVEMYVRYSTCLFCPSLLNFQGILPGWRESMIPRPIIKVDSESHDSSFQTLTLHVSVLYLSFSTYIPSHLLGKGILEKSFKGSTWAFLLMTSPILL